MYKAFRGTKSPSLYTKLKKVIAHIKNDLKTSKRQYLPSLADRMNNNPKEVWHYIKSNRKDPVAIPASRITENYWNITSLKPSALTRILLHVFSP